jgi:pimeloyl-ACP methyl ester carboxylesterase
MPPLAISIADDPAFHQRADGIRIATRFRDGAGPVLVFLPGYMSDMQGSKAVALEGWAAKTGRACLRLDYRGCGESDGRFEDFTLTDWRDDVVAMLDWLAPRPVALIGSSMGGWLMLLAALARPAQVAGLVGIAAAPDFTEWGFSAEERAALAQDGLLLTPSDYSDTPTPTTLGFFTSGEANLLLVSPIPLDCPVRLIHGQCDPDVPWEIALKLVHQLRSADVQTLLVKDGDHRLSRDPDIALLLRTVETLLETL